MILASKIGKHTKQGLKRKYEQIERQNDEIRFFSNSGFYRVGFGNRDKGGVLMMDELIEVNTTWTLKDTNYKVEVIKVTGKKVSYCFLDEFDLITVNKRDFLDRFYKAVSA